MLSVTHKPFMQSVGMLNVVMPSVVAPFMELHSTDILLAFPANIRLMLK
jgi:hypothetical protein